MKAPKTRVDELLVARGLADDLRVARGLLMSGRVMITEPERGERKIEKAGEKVLAAASLRLAGETRRFVSRAGDKLAGALDAFELDVAGLVVVDLGLSTGGFADCLLERGAAAVHGVDLAHGIVDWRIRSDPRVTLYERTDARTVDTTTFGVAADLVTIDVSLVSLTEVLPAALRSLAPGGRIVALIKPQYEVPPSVLVGGIVQSDADRDGAIARVTDAAAALGLTRTHLAPSAVRGSKGNQEHLACFVAKDAE